MKHELFLDQLAVVQLSNAVTGVDVLEDEPEKSTLTVVGTPAASPVNLTWNFPYHWLMPFFPDMMLLKMGAVSSR